jgi:hypothetical protein
MLTRYASGREVLPSPEITVQTGGDIQGNGETYYFWVKAKNRAGYNDISSMTSLVIPDDSKLIIHASIFSQFSYEDWREFIIISSTTNTFSNGKVIYKQEIYQSDQITALSLSNFEFNNSFILTGTGIVTTDLPIDNLSNGMRVKISSVNKVYEYIEGSEEEVDNITVIDADTGRWILVKSNTLVETDFTSNLELYAVDEDNLISSTIQDGLIFPSIKYYIVNNGSNSLESGELDLNSYCSDKSISLNFNVKVIGYLNLSNYTLDTTDILYVGTVVNYPATVIDISKNLPVNSALVIEVTPDLDVDTTLLDGSFISVYPKLNDYTFVDEVVYFSSPVADLSELKALPSTVYRNRQARYVQSKKNIYAFDSSSDLDDDGDTVLIPNNAPTIGRWLVLSSVLADASVTPDKLSNDTLALLDNSIKTTTITINTSTTYTLDLDSQDYDYFIITTPNEDGDSTTINVTASIGQNTTKSIVIELRQRTGIVEFHNSLLFPGGAIPGFSGNGKIDLFVVVLTRDNTSTIKKRIVLSNRDIG